jgi:uncharacterized protein (TIGR02996 family)
VPDSNLLAAIHADRNDVARWLALAAWLSENGRADEAAAVRVFWREIRDGPGGQSIEAALKDVRDHAEVLGRLARQVEGRERA